MGPPLTYLLLFAAWTVALVLALAVVRGLRALRGRSRPEDFTAGVAINVRFAFFMVQVFSLIAMGVIAGTHA